MVATLLPQLQDRISEVENDQLSGSQKQAEQERFQKLIDGLKERVEVLKDAEGKEARDEYVKKVEKTFSEFKSAKPKKETDEKNEQPVPEVKKPEPTPEAPKKPEPEPVKKEEPKKDKASEKK